VQDTNSTIPIVAMSDDLLGSGLITSLSRPGGNTTGSTIQSPELSAKRLELLTHILPGITRVAAIWDPTTGSSQVSMTEQAARGLKIKVQVLEVRRREDLAAAFLAAKAEKAAGDQRIFVAVSFFDFPRHPRWRRRKPVSGDLPVARTC
jgi:putative tryptophan/tyrosine transport system substrate-binding protein